MPRPDGSPAYLDEFRHELSQCTSIDQVHRVANRHPGPTVLTRRMRAWRNAVNRRLEELKPSRRN